MPIISVVPAAYSRHIYPLIIASCHVLLDTGCKISKGDTQAICWIQNEILISHAWALRTANVIFPVAKMKPAVDMYLSRRRAQGIGLGSRGIIAIPVRAPFAD